MAPTRRKGGRAAAAAAACKKWKVGDLVLAKVKGFPAWPATVSAPEKWGYTAGWKKVLVHFFGTQQINALAVCDKNHKMRRLARTTFSIAGKHEMVHGAQCRNDCNGGWFSLLKWN